MSRTKDFIIKKSEEETEGDIEEVVLKLIEEEQNNG